MPTFLSTIKQAHESGDLTDQTTLRQAMMYQNYLDAPRDMADKLEGLPEYPSLDPEKASPGYSGTGTPFHEHFSPGTPYSPTQPLLRVAPAHPYFKDAHNIPRSLKPALQNQTLSASRRVELFERNLLRPWITRQTRGRRTWLYQSDHTTGVTDLLQDLGLYHYRVVDPNMAVFRFTFEPTECRKPHWGDADLSFYFLQTDESEPHGWTLSLRSGEATYPELLHDDVQQLTLTDVLLENVDRHCDLSSPEEAYWNAQRIRINGGVR